METLTRSLLLALAALAAIGFVGFAVVSRSEREPRAARVSLVLGAATALPVAGAAVLPPPARLGTLIVVAALGLAAGMLWFIPAGPVPAPSGRPARRVDERDIMFARAHLTPGSPEYRSYYAMRPDNEAIDARTRSLPGLLSPNARKAEPNAFAAAEASFALTEALRDAVDGPVATRRRTWNPDEATAFVKDLAKRHGAIDVGITEVQPYHLYSHVGRGTGTYGDPIDLGHRWAIAFTVEMDHGAMKTAPEAPVVAESARQYVEAAKIALQIATAIRDGGSPARAHIDGNYRVIAPLVALDAGLGAIGRMGIVMTPRLGPRVRLGVVTTDLPLVPDPPADDSSVIDFCTRCAKCVDNCPSNAIPGGDRTEIDGGLRWALDAEACFRYWNVVGTDCGICMAVCPYSHPDTATHGIVRWAIGKSGNARQAALALDDLFYGRRWSPAQLEDAGQS